MQSGRKAPIVEGATNDSFAVDSPRSVEACQRRGVDVSDLEERSEEFFRWRPPGKGYGEEAPAIRKERHEVNRHRLLREVRLSVVVVSRPALLCVEHLYLCTMYHMTQLLDIFGAFVRVQAGAHSKHRVSIL